jgi:drug/metabolite transporter (DMT)-like permease
MFRDRITGLQGLGVAVSLTGAFVLVSKGEIAALVRLGTGTGELLATAAVVVWSFYSALLKRRPATLDPMALLTASVLAGVLAMTPFYLARSPGLPWTFPVLGALAYIVVFASVLGFVFWSKGVAEIGPNTAGMFLHLMPLFGAVLSIVLLGETVASFHVAGGLLVLGGILLASQTKFFGHVRKAG